MHLGGWMESLAICLKEPEFNLRLGYTFYAANLLEAAEEAFVRVPEESAKFTVAAGYLVSIYQQQGRHEELLRVARNLAANDGHNEWLNRCIGEAHFKSGRVDAAKEIWKQALAGYPSNDEIQAALERTQTKRTSPTAKQVFRDCLEVGLPGHTVIDCIAPLLMEAREVTCCFVDQTSPVERPSFLNDGEHARIMRFVDHLYREYGIYTALLRYLCIGSTDCAALLKLYFSKNGEIYRQVSSLEQSIWNTVDSGSQPVVGNKETVETEGVLLGYPSCCARWAKESRQAGPSIEYAGCTDLIYQEAASQHIGAAELPAPEFAFFAFEFYPCHSRCSEAERVGERIWSTYAKADEFLANTYRRYALSINMLNVRELSNRPKANEGVGALNTYIKTLSSSRLERLQNSKKKRMAPMSSGPE